jgi:hypothetical protein
LLPETFGAMGARPSKYGSSRSVGGGSMNGSQRSLGSPGRGGSTPPRSPSHRG